MAHVHHAGPAAGIHVRQRQPCIAASSRAAARLRRGGLLPLLLTLVLLVALCLPLLHSLLRPWLLLLLPRSLRGNVRREGARGCAMRGARLLRLLLALGHAKELKQLLIDGICLLRCRLLGLAAGGAARAGGAGSQLGGQGGCCGRRLLGGGVLCTAAAHKRQAKHLLHLSVEVVY